MAELSLKERLQPALFDRLIDDERHLVSFEIAVTDQALQELKITAQELLTILEAQGLRRDQIGTAQSAPKAVTWRFVASSSAPSPAQLKALVLRPPGALQGIVLQSFCRIESRTMLNEQPEPGAQHMISMRRLRECVQRDLSWLLNSANLEVVHNLQRHPFVARSVVNYGIPPLAGRNVTSTDPHVTAKRIRDAITAFEPRLSRVQVTPEQSKHSDEMKMSFKIDAELWGQPVAQRLVLRTSIDVDTGDVRITEAS